LRIETKNTL